MPPEKGHDFAVFFLPQREVFEDLFEISGVGGFAKEPSAKLDCGPNRFKDITGQFLRHQTDFRAGPAVIFDNLKIIRFNDPQSDRRFHR